MQKLYKIGSIYYLLQSNLNQIKNIKSVLQNIKITMHRSRNILFEYDIILILLIYSQNNFVVIKRVTQRHLYNKP